MAVSATTRAPHGRNRVGPPDTRVGPDDRDTVPPSCRWCHAWVPSWNVEAAHHSGAARWSDHPSVPFRRSQVLRGVSGLSYHFWVRNGLPPLPTTGPDPTPSGAPTLLTPHDVPAVPSNQWRSSRYGRRKPNETNYRSDGGSHQAIVEAPLPAAVHPGQRVSITCHDRLACFPAGQAVSRPGTGAP